MGWTYEDQQMEEEAKHDQNIDHYLERSDFFDKFVRDIIEDVLYSKNYAEEEGEKVKENEPTFKIPFNGNMVQFAELIDVLQKQGWIDIKNREGSKTVMNLWRCFDIKGEQRSLYNILKKARREKEIYGNGYKENLSFQEIKKRSS